MAYVDVGGQVLFIPPVFPNNHMVFSVEHRDIHLIGIQHTMLTAIENHIEVSPYPTSWKPANFIQSRSPKS